MSEDKQGRSQVPGTDFPINAFTTSGIDLAELLNRFEQAFHSGNFGAALPPEGTTGCLWTKASDGGGVDLYVYDGSRSTKIGTTDGISTDMLDLNALLNYIDNNLARVESWNGRDGEVVPAEGDYNLNQMGDVGLSNLVKDDYLQWNGTSWENNPPKLIETELNFMGGYDVTQQPPSNPGHGDLYINNKNGNAASGWTGIAGLYVNVGNALGYSKNHNANGDQVPEGTGGAWFLLGEVFTGGVTSIGAGTGISVNSDTPTSPVVSINRNTTDGWYQPVGDYLTSSDLSSYATELWVDNNFQRKGSYALASHDHDGTYSKVGHTHTEYEPVIGLKGSAFNKSFGVGFDFVARGDHTHDQYQPIGTLPDHTHPANEITAGTFPAGVFGFTGNVNMGGVLTVDSTIRSSDDVVAYFSSDERLKDNVKTIEGALAKVLSLRGVEFDWNDKQQTYSGHDYSVIAQDVEQAFPELVVDRDSGYKAVKMERLVAPMIEAIRELSEEVRALKAEVADLKGGD